MDSGRDRSQNVPAPSELRPVDPVGSRAREPALGVDYRLEPHLPQDGIDLRRYLLAVWRHKWLVMLVTFLGTAAGVGGARFIEPQYEAEATLWIETVRGTDARQGPIQSSELLRSSGWVDLLHSYVVLDQVVRDMQLYLQVESAADSAAFAGFAVVDRPVPGSYRLQVSNRGDVVDLYAEGGRLVETVPAGDSVGLPSGFTWAPPRHALRPGAVIEFEVANPREVANSVAGAMRTRLNPNGNFFHVGFRGTDPEETAAILNEITGRYVEVAAELKAAKLEEYREKLNDQLGYAWQNLEQAEAALENFRVQTITLPSEPASPVAPGLELTRDPAFANFFELKVDEDQLRRDREDLERALTSAADGGVSIEALEVIPAVRGSSELVSALGELTSKRAELRVLQNRYSDEYPTVRSLAGEIETLQRSAIPGLVRELRDELIAREAEAARLIASASRELSEVPPRAIEEARLERRVQIAENLYTMLQSRFEEARLAAASSIPDVRILDPAVRPHDPINETDKPRLILLALLASLGFAVVGAVLLDQLDRRLKYPEQVSEQLGLGILGTVPHVSSPKGELGVNLAAEVVEAFRVVRLNLMHAYGKAGPVVVTVTSPSPEDGKSFVSANLALAFADLGRRTLLIDADVRRGHLHRLFGGLRKPGLTDYLMGRASREQVLQPTTYGTLDRVGCGTRRRDAPELLQSNTMAVLLAELRPLYDVIIIDTSPLAAGVDPLALGTLTGNVLIVLRTGATDRELTEAKLDMLDTLPIRILGAVLNDVPLKGAYSYYRYYTSGYETWDEDAATASEELNGEGAVAVGNHVAGKAPRPGSVYLPNGKSDGGDGEPEVREEIEEPEDKTAGAEPERSAAPPPPVARAEPVGRGRPVEPAKADNLTKPAPGPIETPESDEGDGPRAEARSNRPAVASTVDDIWYEPEWDLWYNPDWDVRSSREVRRAPAVKVNEHRGGAAVASQPEGLPPAALDVGFTLDSVTLEPQAPAAAGGNGDGESAGAAPNGSEPRERRLLQDRRQAQQRRRMEERRLAERRRAEERRRLLDRRANGDDGGNGAQPPAHGNGSEQDLQVYAEAQLEHFREHQRRHRHRFWK